MQQHLTELLHRLDDLLKISYEDLSFTDINSNETNTITNDKKDNVNELSENITTEYNKLDLILNLNEQNLLEDCRKERPKKKVRPPSQVFLKQVILNTPDEEKEDVFNAFFDNNYESANVNDSTTNFNDATYVVNSPTSTDNSTNFELITNINSSTDVNDSTEFASLTDAIDSTNLTSFIITDEEPSYDKFIVLDDLLKENDNDDFVTLDIVKKPQMKNMFSIELMGEMRKTLSEKTTEKVSSSNVQIETKTNQFNEEPSWMKEISNRKMYKTNTNLLQSTNVDDDVMNINLNVNDIDDLHKLETQVTQEVFEDPIVMNIEKTEIVESFENVKSDYVKETSEEKEEDLYVTLRKPTRVNVDIGEKDLNNDNDMNVVESVKIVEELPNETVIDSSLKINIQECPLISKANQCIRKSREIIKQEFNLTPEIADEHKRFTLNLKPENPESRRFELSEKKLSPTTITFIPKPLNSNADSIITTRNVDILSTSPNNSEGIKQVSRTIIFTSNDIGEKGATSTKKEEIIYELNDDNTSSRKTKIIEEVSHTNNDNCPIIKSNEPFQENPKTNWTRDDVLKNCVAAFKDRPRTFCTARVSVKEKITQLYKKDDTKQNVTDDDQIDNKPEWLKVLRSRKPSVIPKTERPLTWLDEMKLRKERLQETAHSIDE